MGLQDIQIDGMRRRIERYIKTDTTYLFSGGFWLGLAKVVSLLVSFAVGVAFANLLPKELYGNYKYIISLASIIGTISLSGLGTALTRAAARGFDGELDRSYRLSFYSSLVGSFAAIMASAYYFYFDNALLGWSFVIIAIVNPYTNVSSLFRSYLSGKMQFRAQALGTTLQNIIPSVLIIAALFVSHSVILLVAITLVATAAVGLVVEWYARAVYKTNNERDPQAAQLATHTSVLNFMGAFASKIDAILVFQNMGGTALAIYAFAAAMPETIRGSLKIITSLAVPKFATMTSDDISKSLVQKALPSTVLIACITILYIVLAPFVFTIFFPKYMDSLLYSQVYALTILFSAPLITAYFDSQLAIYERYVLGISGAIGQTILAVGGLYFFGLWGVIASRILYRIFMIILSVYLIRRR
ncbi:MAG: hypothetical protein RLZZ283_5 [Candidatus Parcubacteria bacterium]